MDITVALKKLRPAVAAAAKLAKRTYGIPGTTLAAADGVLTVTGSDGETTVATRVAAEVRVSGALSVEGAALVPLLKGTGAVDLCGSEGGLRVTNGIVSTVALVEAGAEASEEWGEGAWTVDLATVREVAAAASTDQARPVLTGVLFDGPHVVGTDSYRLHLAEVAEVAGAGYPTVLVPGGAFGLLPTVGTAVMRVGTRTVPGREYVAYEKGERIERKGPDTTQDVARLEVGAVVVTVRLIDREFPQWRPLVPHALTVDREAFAALIAAVGAAAGYSGTGYQRTANPVRLRVERGELVVWAQGEQGEEISAGRCTVKGEDLELCPPIAFNPAFLGDAVTTLRGDTVTLEFTDSQKPAMLAEGRDGGRAVRLVMPVRCD